MSVCAYQQVIVWFDETCSLRHVGEDRRSPALLVEQSVCVGLAPVEPEGDRIPVYIRSRITEVSSQISDIRAVTGMSYANRPFSTHT
jgi:hypothetical protein